ncbi:MAG: F0F1 ATP synthase subunit B [Alphaproteobacteria bacterium]|nr:F0F1 ATP synthase subunit B [Alphaproteobacteria bacterium]
MHETSLLNDTMFWYAIGAGIFFVLALIGGRKPMTGWLDSEIDKVRAELDEAKRLRAEAEATLADYKARQQDAAKEAEAIINEARLDASRLRNEAEAELRDTLDRHEQLFIDRLKLAQEDALDEVRNFVIDEVLIEARGKMMNMAKAGETTPLLEKIIDDLPKLHKRKSA